MVVDDRLTSILLWPQPPFDRNPSFGSHRILSQCGRTDNMLEVFSVVVNLRLQITAVVQDSMVSIPAITIVKWANKTNSF